jgi:hypothetical protein
MAGRDRVLIVRRGSQRAARRKAADCQQWQNEGE